MYQPRIQRRALIALLLMLAFLPAPLRATESCSSGNQASLERAVLQAQGERFQVTACAGDCQDITAEVAATYGRAVIQAQGERLLAPTAAETIASYERATIQVQGQVMENPTQATCGATLA